MKQTESKSLEDLSHQSKTVNKKIQSIHSAKHISANKTFRYVAVWESHQQKRRRNKLHTCTGLRPPDFKKQYDDCHKMGHVPQKTKNVHFVQSQQSSFQEINFF